MTPHFLDTFKLKLESDALKVEVDSDDDYEGGVKRKPSEFSLFTRLMTTKTVIPLYALATNHKNMQKVQLRRRVRDEFHAKIRKQMLDLRAKSLEK